MSGAETLIPFLKNKEKGEKPIIIVDSREAKTAPKIVKGLKELGAEILAFQSNSEGALIDFIQAKTPQAAGIIINPGALTHYGLSLRDALEDSTLPIIEVHLSDIHTREEWRHKSVIVPIAQKQITGKGIQGYIDALEILVTISKESR